LKDWKNLTRESSSRIYLAANCRARQANATFGAAGDHRIARPPGFCTNFGHALNNPMIREGDPAPDFDLETDEGTRVSLSSLEGRNVVLFFYPKDNTSG
jgi:hypothetical protein